MLNGTSDFYAIPLASSNLPQGPKQVRTAAKTSQQDATEKPSPLLTIHSTTSFPSPTPPKDVKESALVLEEQMERFPAQDLIHEFSYHLFREGNSITDSFAKFRLHAQGCNFWNQLSDFIRPILIKEKLGMLSFRFTINQPFLFFCHCNFIFVSNVIGLAVLLLAFALKNLLYL